MLAENVVFAHNKTLGGKRRRSAPLGRCELIRGPYDRPASLSSLRVLPESHPRALASHPTPFRCRAGELIVRLRGNSATTLATREARGHALSALGFDAVARDAAGLMPLLAHTVLLLAPCFLASSAPVNNASCSNAHLALLFSATGVVITCSLQLASQMQRPSAAVSCVFVCVRTPWTLKLVVLLSSVFPVL